MDYSQAFLSFLIPAPVHNVSSLYNSFLLLSVPYWKPSFTKPFWSFCLVQTMRIRYHYILFINLLYKFHNLLCIIYAWMSFRFACNTLDDRENVDLSLCVYPLAQFLTHCLMNSCCIDVIGNGHQKVYLITEFRYRPLGRAPRWSLSNLKRTSVGWCFKFWMLRRLFWR